MSSNHILQLSIEDKTKRNVRMLGYDDADRRLFVRVSFIELFCGADVCDQAVSPPRLWRVERGFVGEADRAVAIGRVFGVGAGACDLELGADARKGVAVGDDCGAIRGGRRRLPSAAECL